MKLDKDFLNTPRAKKVLADAENIFQQAMADAGLDRNRILQDVMDGQTIAQVRGLTRDDLEVIYATGFNFINNGSLQQAEDTFVTLCVIDPLEAKNHYCLGIVRQMKQDWFQAVEDFARFLAMDATNPEGYLRIGECLNAQGKRSEARQVFETALELAEKGKGPPSAKAQAERALALLQEGEKV